MASSLISVVAELVWFGVDAVGLLAARPRAADAPGVVALLVADEVEVTVVDVDVAPGWDAVDVLALDVGSLRSSLEGVDARESLSLPLELAPSDFFALGVAPNGMRLANLKKNDLNYNKLTISRRRGKKDVCWDEYTMIVCFL